MGLAPDLSIVILGRDGSLTPSSPALAFLDKVEFNDVSDVAERLFPLGREAPVVLDPHRGFGEPTIPEIGVRTVVCPLLRGRANNRRRRTVCSRTAPSTPPARQLRRH